MEDGSRKGRTDSWETSTRSLHDTFAGHSRHAGPGRSVASRNGMIFLALQSFYSPRTERFRDLARFCIALDAVSRDRIEP